MTTDEAQAALPRMRLQQADENGERMASALRTRNEETDADSVSLKFLDNKLTSIEVRYNLEWENMDEFVARVSEALSLPANAWRSSQTTTNRRNMQCPGFHIEVEMLSTSTTTIHLYDPTAAEAIAQRIRARETRRRQAFIP